MKTQFQQFYDRFFFLFRGALVFFLIIILLIPQFFIAQLITERKYRHAEVVEEITGKWGGMQQIEGPLLLVPSYINKTDETSGLIYHWIKPDELNIHAEVEPEIKYRSIYKVVLYKTQVTIKGSYHLPSGWVNKIQEGYFANQHMAVCMGMSDYTGLTNEVTMTSNGDTSRFSANDQPVQFLSDALSAPIKWDSLYNGNTQEFTIQFTLKGSYDLKFIPVAKKTQLTMHSTWNKPSFIGTTLPESTVTDSGFTAVWNIIDVKNSIPHFFDDMPSTIHSEPSAGVTLLQGQDHYSKTTRSIKYAILIITLTFVVYMFIELLQKKRINGFQYILVGAALCIFYTLLLSISEYVGFNIAYLIASAAVILQITLYTGMVFKRLKTGIIFGVLITMLFAFIYSLIQLDDYSLLAGSVGLFVILSILMFVSRKIQWTKSQDENAETGA